MAISERHLNRELTPPIENRFWISPDIHLVDGIKLKSGERAKARIQLTAESLPSLNQVPLEFIRHLRVSIRSRSAQGFNDVENTSEEIYTYLLENGINSLGDVDPKYLMPWVTFRNDAMRSNILRPGGIFRLYYPGGQHLVGDALTAGGILIDDCDVPQEMWKRNTAGMPVALRLPLNPDTRMWIPGGNKPINIDPEGQDRRNQVNNLLARVPNVDVRIPYLVYSKHKVGIPEGVYGIVASYAYSAANGKENQNSVSSHGSSQLLDPNNHLIIFETIGRTTPHEVANYVDINLFAA